MTNKIKQHNPDLALGVVIALVIGISVLLVQPSAFFFFASGLASGYGLRVAMVKAWPCNKTVTK